MIHKQYKSNNSYHILLVEDNKIVQQVSQIFLNEFAQQVHLAKNVETARLLATTNPYDLILLDIGLPDGDGKNVARAVREDVAGINKGIPIVAVTAHGDLYEDACFDAGIDCIYIKPLTRNIIVEIMQQFNLIS